MNEISLKILIIGDSGVGKKSLLLKYCNCVYSQNNVATIGIEFKEKIINLNGKEIKLQIWNTSGQERFRFYIQNFYRKADGIIFVFDITNMESFNHIKERLLDFEPNDSYSKNILVGNKIDLVDKRVIDKEKMENFAENKKIRVFETSAKRGDNVDNIFTELASLILADKNDEEIFELFCDNRRSIKLPSVLNNSGNRSKKCC